MSPWRPPHVTLLLLWRLVSRMCSAVEDVDESCKPPELRLGTQTRKMCWIHGSALNPLDPPKAHKSVNRGVESQVEDSPRIAVQDVEEVKAPTTKESPPSVLVLIIHPYRPIVYIINTNMIYSLMVLEKMLGS